MYPLKLSASSEAWRMFTARKEDPAFGSFRDKIFTRDHYSCQFCGFQARDYQEVVNIDRDYSNNKMSNLATACCFCAQCFFLESVGMGEYGGGTLIYLPEISQSDLNSFCHVLFCAISNNTNYKDTAQSVYRTLRFRSQMVDDKYGDGSSDPASFGQALIDLQLPDKSAHARALNDLRLLPSLTKFKTQIERWAATALEELSEDESPEIKSLPGIDPTQQVETKP